jgi:hypothetical protein
MKILGQKSLAFILKILFDILYYTLLVSSVGILLLFILKFINPDSETLEFTFNKEMAVSEMISNFPEEIDIPAVLGVKINNIRINTALEITEAQSLFLAFFSYVYAMGFLLFFFYSFRKIFKNFINSNNFSADHAVRISAVGIAIIVTELISFIIVGIFDIHEICIKFFSSTVSATYGTSISMFFIGFALIVLGEIFRQGTLLKEEQQLTI